MRKETLLLMPSLVVASALSMRCVCHNDVTPASTTRVDDLEIQGTTQATGLMTLLGGMNIVTGSLSVQEDVGVGGFLGVTGEVKTIAGLRLTNTATGPTVTSGTGDPNGSITAPVGSVRLRSDTAELYQNTDGATAWSQVGAASSQNPLKAVMTAAVAVSNTETVLTSFTLPQNTLTPGTVITFDVNASRSGVASVSPTVRVRIGPTTLTGTEVFIGNGITTSNTGGMSSRGSITVLTDGAAATTNGEGFTAINTGTNTIAASNNRTDAAVIDTTVDNRVELTFISGDAGNTYSVKQAILWLYEAP